MEGWTGTTLAVAAAVVAICMIGLTVGLLIAVREARELSGGLAKELSELRHELAPTLHAVSRLSDSGAQTVERVGEELDAVIDLSRRIRDDVEVGVERARSRLQDIDALVEVVHEEVEETALDVTAALRTARNGSGMIGQLRRMILPRRSRRG
jgi:methyl-accepting chemotaxis protein